MNQYVIIPLFNNVDSVKTGGCVFQSIRINVRTGEYLSKLPDAWLQEELPEYCRKIPLPPKFTPTSPQQRDVFKLAITVRNIQTIPPKKTVQKLLCPCG